MPSLLRRVANRSLDALFLPPLDGLFAHRFRGTVVCLLYHRVADPGAEPILDRFGAPPIAPRELEDEMRLLAAWGARFMTVDDLLRGVWPGADEFGVIVTFDDGYRDTYDNGLPVLESLGIRATLFQASRMLAECGELIWEHQLYEMAAQPGGAEVLTKFAREYIGQDTNFSAGTIVEALREDADFNAASCVLAQARGLAAAKVGTSLTAARIYPSASMIQAALTRGHEIGSHGCRHLKRTSISRQVFEQEVATSQIELERICGHPPRCFSFPFNSYMDGDQVTVAKYFQLAFTVDARPVKSLSDPAGVPRFTWPGPHQNLLRRRRWLRTGRI